MPHVLTIDTALDRCATAIVTDGQVIGESAEDMRVGHAERLFGLIETTLAAARVTYNNLGAIAVVSGPGSFSGVRIGVAAARGLALALGVPAIGVGTLEGLAEEARQQNGTAERIVAANAAPLERSFLQQFSVLDGRVHAVG